VLELLVQRRYRVDLMEHAIYLDPLEALFLQLLEFPAVLPLAPPHHRGEEQQAAALGHGQHPVDHLGHRLAFDRQAGGR
jgi:hypothetical protein